MIGVILSTFFIASNILFAAPTMVIDSQSRWSLNYKTALVGRSAFSPDSSKVATANRTGQIQLWDVANGRLIKTSTQQNKLGHDNPIYWSSDGKYILTPSILWHSRSLKIAKRFGYNGVACAFSSDGTQFAAYVSPSPNSQQKQLNIYDTSSKKRLKTLYSTHDTAAYYPSELQFTEDGRHLLVGLQNAAKGIQIWDTKTFKQVNYLRTNIDVTDLQLSPDQKTLAIGTLNTQSRNRFGKGSIILYSYPSLRKLHEFSKLKGHITAIDFHPSSAYLVSTQYHSRPTFHLWDIKNKKLLLKYDRIKRNTNFAQFSPNGQFLAVVSQTFGDMGNPINFDMYDIDLHQQSKDVLTSKNKNKFRKGQKVTVLHNKHWYTGIVNRKGKRSYLIKMDRRKPKYWLWVKPKNMRPIKRIIKRLTK